LILPARDGVARRIRKLMEGFCLLVFGML